MPEAGVEFNAAPVPPPEYLMRRSYQPRDARIPGAVVRTRVCPECGNIQTDGGDLDHGCNRCLIGTDPHSVDVPLVKSNGERWS